MATPLSPPPTKATFLAQGFDLTILDTTADQQDCGICTKPIYKPQCDNDAKTHDHGPHCTPEPKQTLTAAPLVVEYPQPGIKIKACGHVLGYRCALRWFDMKNTCPFCRREVFALREEGRGPGEDPSQHGSGRVVTWF